VQYPNREAVLRELQLPPSLAELRNALEVGISRYPHPQPVWDGEIIWNLWILMGEYTAFSFFFKHIFLKIWDASCGNPYSI
jgi:hypothetical protein